MFEALLFCPRGKGKQVEKKIVQGGSSPKATHRQDTYFIASMTKNNRIKAIKIGLCARGQILSRLRTLSTGSVDTLKVLAVYCGPIEAKLHRRFSKSRLRKNSEFFRPTKALLKLTGQLAKISEMLGQLDALDIDVKK